MSFTKEQVIAHYKLEATKHGLEGTSTIQDFRTRILELEAIFSYIRDGSTILEIGCGNGYTASEIVKNFDVSLDATDFSEDMIATANKRELGHIKGRVLFHRMDVLDMDIDGKYDLIFTERCLQNLPTWDEQKRALANIAKALAINGQFVMLESFWTGLNKLNEARRELELSEIEGPWHNLLFDEEETRQHLASLRCSYVGQNSFLSGYYFGSRVLLPAIMPNGKAVTSNSVLNDYFFRLPPHGDFCPMKILQFIKEQ